MKTKQITAEERAFVNYIKGVVSENRADVNLTKGDNGAVIPSTIADKIIETLSDISPLYDLSHHYDVVGKLVIPYYDESTQGITVSYVQDFVPLGSSAGKIETKNLDGFLVGVLTKVSKSLFRNSDFDIAEVVVKLMAKAIHEWLENELINGTVDKVEGLTTVTQKITAASPTAVTADELIDLQELIRDEHQKNAVWIMSRETRKAAKKLKDAAGNSLMHPEFDSRWGYTLLGREVYTTKNMPEMVAGSSSIFYGDMSGLAVKFPESIEVQALHEKYEDEHAIGILSWAEVDAKVEDTAKIAKMEMAAV